MTIWQHRNVQGGTMTWHIGELKTPVGVFHTKVQISEIAEFFKKIKRQSGLSLCMMMSRVAL